MTFKKLLCVLMVFALAAAAFACAKPAAAPAAATPDEEAAAPADDGKVYEMNVSFASPEFTVTGVTAALNRVQAASNGRIKFTYYYSWSLTSVPTVVDDMKAGVVDIAAVPINEHLNLFPYSNLITYTPFLGLPDFVSAGKIYDEMYDENPQFAEEFAQNGLVYWSNYPCPPYHIFTVKDYEVKTPDDLNGLKIITSSSMMQQFIAAHGGAPVSTPVTEYATSLNAGVAEGLINHSNVVTAFGCSDFIKAGTLFGEQGTAVSLMMVCISQSAWDKLPADLQQLFLDEADGLRDEQSAVDFANNAKNIEAWEANGAKFTKLTAEEIKVWSDAFEAQRGEYIQSLIDSGATDAQALYDALQTKLAE